MASLSRDRLGTIRFDWLKIIFCGLALLAPVENSCATGPISTDSPLNFFTNVAARVLSTGMNMDLNRIQIYPTNRYTPAVHRLLQVTANIYDATTTNFYPTIFRPLFTVDSGGDVFISGYTNQTNLIAHASQMLPGANDDVLDPPVEAAVLPPGTNILANVYGVPWIIGAKKGFPNFNAFSVESAFQLVRKLEFIRDTNAMPQPDITWTNQMYLMNVTNFFALSCWNSYQSNYPGPVDILVRCSSSMMLTNDNNMFPYGFGTNFLFATEIAPNWPGWNGVLKTLSPSFVVPLNTSVLALTNAMYVYNEPNPPKSAMLFPFLGENPSYFLDSGIRPLPHFWLLMTNRLQVAIIDYSTNVSPLNVSGPSVGRIVDYVQLDGMNSSQLLNSALPENDLNSCWNTNYDALGNLLGVFNQIRVSLYGTTITGQSPTGLGSWNTGPIPGGPASDTSPMAQQSFFRGFFSPDGSYSYDGAIYFNTQSVVRAPYMPIAFAIQHTTWAANDPLVHYLASDLAPHTDHLQVVDWGYFNPQMPNQRYQPWGISTASVVGVDTNPNNLAYKDPLVRSSDNWNFPRNEILNVGWLGQVHRGTPWQTIYLKPTNIVTWVNNSLAQTGLATWMNWTGDCDPADAAAMAPVQDWHLVGLLASLFNTNNLASLISVNNPDPNAWRVTLNGMTVLTNISSDVQIRFPVFPPQLSALVISSNALQAAMIANAIQSARNSQPGQFFPDIGDILTIPQLTVVSPYLNVSSAIQITNGISDEAYEAIPSQLLPLLRTDSLGSVMTANGQRVIQFTGYDGHDYALEFSTNLVNWTSISTNSPAGGVLNFTNEPAPGGNVQFYRSVLLN